MKIRTIGYDSHVEKRMTMSFPLGVGSGLLILLKGKACFKVGELLHDVKQPSFIILTPDMPCEYECVPELYLDDWMYFDYEEGDVEKISKHGIPLNEFVRINDTEELSDLMKQLTNEHYSREPFSGEIEKGMLDVLLCKLGRNCMEYEKIYISHENKQKLLLIKNVINSAPTVIDTVEIYAYMVNMSVSNLQHLYKKMFGTTIKQDIIASRNDHAKHLLKQTDLPVAQIALRCGYESEYSFMNQFKCKVGETPTEYRYKNRT